MRKNKETNSVEQLNFVNDPFRGAELKARRQDFEIEQKEREGRRKNHDFIQYRRKGLKFLIKIMTENSLAAKIFVFLTEFMDYKNAVVCSSKTLEEYFECSRTTIYRAIKYLEENYYVMTANVGSAKLFTMNPDIVWTTYADKKAFCEFDGKVIINETENKEFLIKAQKFKEIMLKEPGRKKA